MSIKLPLYQRSGSILFLDDDTDYLEILGVSLDASYQVELFSRASTFISRMERETLSWETDLGRHLQMLERWRHGRPLLPQVLEYWGTHPSRYRIAQIAVVDYALPGTNGLKVLDTMLDWPGSRILLTGQADEQIAVQAFNGGLIQKFLAKQNASIASILRLTLDELCQSPHPRMDTIWRTALSPSQYGMLQDLTVSTVLRELTRSQWIEHVVLGEPFGVLGLDAGGHCQWLQLEPISGLKDLADLARAAGLHADEAKQVQHGRILAAVELQQQLGRAGSVRTAPAMPIDSQGTLLGALFRLEADDLPIPIGSYRRFLELNTIRQVQDN
jgi:CheY-like chemotaxis protein